MSDLPTVTGPEAIKAFSRAGFSVNRIKGSHHIMKKPGHRYNLPVPVHGSKNIATGTLRQFINASGMTVEEFIAFL